MTLSLQWSMGIQNASINTPPPKLSGLGAIHSWQEHQQWEKNKPFTAFKLLGQISVVLGEGLKKRWGTCIPALVESSNQFRGFGWSPV